MSVELSDVVALSKNVKGFNDNTGPHYLLGYIWANLSDEKQKQIYKTFQEKETN
jgi:hypothetical protein